MFKLRRMLAVLIIAAVTALVASLWWHLKQQSAVELLQALPDQVDLALEELHYTQNEDGRRRWTLDADKAEYLRDQSHAELENLSLVLFEAGQFKEVKLTAKHGTLEQADRQVEVWEQVVVTSERGEQLFTERLHYDGKQRVLRTKEPIRLVTPRMELTGVGLQADLVNDRILVEKDVWMLLIPAEREASGD